MKPLTPNGLSCNVAVRGHQQAIFVTVNKIGPLGGGEGVQLKSLKIFTFVLEIELKNLWQ